MGVAMKVGLRKPSIKRSLKARTTGRMKRKVKRSANPLYGRRGMGWLFKPLKAAYNWLYRRLTISIPALIRRLFGK